MNKTLFLFIRKFYAGLTDMRMPKQIESEQSNVIGNENLVQNDDNDLDGRSDGLRHNPNA
ncbi:hypothetical protein FF021_13820 [Leptospira noguchii]|nr:hypothetical protein FF021_13820 [Leptospira noguchii]